MKSTITSIALALLPSFASAGCYNAEGNLTDAPRFEICYDGVCDETAQLYVCANVSQLLEGFEIGWSRECNAVPNQEQFECTIFWEGRKIDPSKYDLITFTPLD